MTNNARTFKMKVRAFMLLHELFILGLLCKMFFSCTCASFRLNVAGFGKSDLCQKRTDDFVDQNGEQSDVADDGTVRAKLDRFDRHTERDTCLWQQSNPKIPTRLYL